MDKEKLARYMEYRQLKQKEKEEQEYLNYLKYSLQPEKFLGQRDPDLPLNAEPVEEEVPEKKSPELDYNKVVGETAAPVMRALTETFKPLTENLMDKSPGERILAGAEILDNVTSRPIRYGVYKMLGGEKEYKDNTEGSDIINQLEKNVGAPMPEMPGAKIQPKDILAFGADIGLDASNLIPALGALKIASKAPEIKNISKAAIKKMLE